MILRDLLERFISRPKVNAAHIVDLGVLSGPVYAIGDVHGCLELMRSALKWIHEDAAGAAPTVILLGDLVDRGPESAGVLEQLLVLAKMWPIRSVMGNHERMMLSFHAEPARAWDWLHVGGYETLRSYGIDLEPTKRPSERRLRQILDASIPRQHICWLKQLPHGYKARIGAKDFLFVHAGIDGRRPLDQQDEAALLWGRGTATSREEGLCVVQGHVTVREPELSEHEARIDTGAWITGVLTILRLGAELQPSVISIRK